MCKIRWRKKIRQISFLSRAWQHFGTHRRCAAQLQRRSTETVMIPADVLTTHFGIHRRCTATASSFNAVIKLVLCSCLYWPNRLGWRQKVIKPLKTFMKLSWWCPLGQGKGHLLAKEYIIMDRLIPILTHLSSHLTVPLITI